MRFHLVMKKGEKKTNVHRSLFQSPRITIECGYGKVVPSDIRRGQTGVV